MARRSLTIEAATETKPGQMYATYNLGSMGSYSLMGGKGFVIADSPMQALSQIHKACRRGAKLGHGKPRKGDTWASEFCYTKQFGVEVRALTDESKHAVQELIPHRIQKRR